MGVAPGVGEWGIDVLVRRATYACTSGTSHGWIRGSPPTDKGPQMLARLSFSLYDLRDSLWYRPAIMTLGAMVLAFITLRIDERVLSDSHFRTWWIFGGGTEGARGVLSAIAGTMMTVVTTAFSITMVTLQLGSSQYSPRILRNFTGDRGNQLVLGIFIATFVYCLLVLRAVRSELEDRGPFVPGFSITIAMLLALICIGSLIFFFHHATRTIQASVVLDNTARDAFGLIDQHIDVQENRKRDERTDALLARLPVVLDVAANNPGYLRGVDDSRLLALATEHDLLLSVHPRVGDHIFTGSSLVTVRQRTSPELGGEGDSEASGETIGERAREAMTAIWDEVRDVPEDREENGDEAVESPYEGLEASLRPIFTIGMERTLNEDVLFALQQLVDIGMRALSPGVNDPTTAMLAIDQIGEGLIRLQGVDDRPTVAVDEDGTPRVVYPPIPFDMFLDTTLGHLRQFAADDVFVCAHLIAVLRTVWNSAMHNAARSAIAAEARLVVDAVEANAPLPEDLLRVRKAAAWAYATGDGIAPV